MTNLDWMDEPMEALIVDVFDDELCYPALSFKFPLKEAFDALKGQPPVHERLVNFGSVLIDGAEFATTDELLKGTVPIQSKYYGLRYWKSGEEDLPYLVHTGFELPLLLDGRKKLGWLNVEPGDGGFEKYRLACFERFVAQGILGKHEDVYGRDGGMAGTIYYFPLDEAWRVPALMFIRKASRECGGWSEVFERQEGALMGYSRAENDVWIENCLRSGNSSLGMSICCLLSNEELSFVKHSGLRALPWNRDTDLTCFRNVDMNEESLQTLVESYGKSAVVRFWINRDEFLKGIEKTEISPGAWIIDKNQISLVNSLLKGKLYLVYEGL
ncbi:hypothetical protein [Paraburkholderia sediminicola]|uniref:hypothetical protein n=1 Tax=Paraburkholderia sediminicola TaxID=458836 RepID=UPI0038B6E6BE